MFEKPDYVIVGAGSAGCVLASRLTEDPDTRVLLLEAGSKDRSPLIHIPLMAGMMLEEGMFDWGFSSEPEPALNNRRIKAPRGKVLGGSSSTNFTGYTRGDRADYDGWERLGLAGWGWRDVLPYFKRAEHWEGGETETRGGTGLLGVEYEHDPDPMWDALRAATQAQGILWNDDPASGEIEGIGRCQYTIRNGRRSSTATAYLKPVRNRSNLQVVTNASVVRLLIENNSARGVVVRHGGSEYEVLPTREVILSAGVYKTPQLLMMAGIGRPADLAPSGVTCIADLPVGKNLQEHWSVVTLQARSEPGVMHSIMRVDRMIRYLAMAYFLGKGPATTIPSGLMGFVRSAPEVPAPDIEFMFAPMLPPFAYPWFPGLKPSYRDGFGINPAIVHPFSRGTVSIASTNPEAAPLVRFNAFSDERDLALMVHAVRLARAIAEGPALAALRVEEILPGPGVTSDADIEAFIRETAITVSHSCGTCAMGPDGVLDGEMRLRGIERVRVVDASAMPTIVTGHTNACVIMMAERAADFIRAKPR